MVRKSLFWILKALFLALAFYFLYLKVEGLSFESINWQWHSQSWIYLGLFILVWAANLVLDARAWQIVQSILYRIPLSTAIIHNLKSYGLAFISPMNSGEIVGRYIIQERAEDRKKALFLTLWAHFPKITSKALVSTIILFFLLELEKHQTLWQFSLVLAFALIMTLYLKLEKIISLLHEAKIWKRPVKDYLVTGKPEPGQKLVLLVINGLRFLLFSAQLALVLMTFKVDLLTWPLYWSIPLFYFSASLLPSFSGIDFLIKGTLALYFFGLFETDALSFTLAGTAVWFFNLAMPAITGLSLLKKSEFERFRRKTG